VSTTSIEWTDKTWGPVVGCTHKSPGCLHCYAETMAGRQVPMSAAQGRRSVYLRVIQPGTRKWSRPADVQRDPEHRRHVELLPERLAQPLRWRAGTRVFVCSMSDLFHEDVPFDYLAQVFGVMAATPGVTYQVLTKRPERMREFFEHRFGLEGIADTVFREAMEHRGVIWDGRAPRMGWPRGSRPIDYAHLYPQAPDPKTLHKNPRIDLVIVGGESGPKARPMGEVLASPLDPLPGGDLVRSLRDQCEAAGVAFFFKQWGGVNKAKAGRMLDGRTHDAMPEVRRG